MRVFKTFLKIAVHKIPTVIMYFVIFAIILICTASDASQNNEFEQTRLVVSVNDLDNSAASRELAKYIAKNHNIVDIGTDDESIQDALYYHTLSYFLTINEGFEEKLENGETDGLFESIKDANYKSQYLDTQLTEYVSAASMFIARGMSAQQACAETSAASDISVEVTVESFSSGEALDSDFAMFIQYLAYVLVLIMMLGLTPILITFNQSDIRRRMDSSALPISRKTMQLILGSSVVTAAVWIAFMLLGVVCYGGKMFTETGGLAMLNSFVYVIIFTGAAVLAAQFELNANVLSMVSNVISLGMCFLCGVFVPQEMLGNEVLSAAKFLPAYWYVKANNMLFGLGDTAFTAAKYMTYLGVEMLFAIALFTAAMAVARTKMRSSQ